MNVAWTGYACAVGGAAVITIYTIANYRLRYRGVGAVWSGGWILGGVGMTLIAVGWGLLGIAGPHYHLPPLRYLGLALSLLAGLLYFIAAAYVGRLRSRKRFSLQLHTRGIYKLVRHPQALALSILAIGVGLTTLSRPFLWGLPLWVGFWIAYTFLEEQFELIPAYGEEYQRYRRETPRLLPSVNSWRAFLPQRRGSPLSSAQ